MLEAAIDAFSQHGFAATSTRAIARSAQISHAYVFRLFATRQALALGAMRLGMHRLHDAMATAAGRVPVAERFDAMAEAYADRRLLLLQQHGIAAGCTDLEMRAVVRDGWIALVELVERESGVSRARVHDLLATAALDVVLGTLFDDAAPAAAR